MNTIPEVKLFSQHSKDKPKINPDGLIDAWRMVTDTDMITVGKTFRYDDAVTTHDGYSGSPTIRNGIAHHKGSLLCKLTLGGDIHYDSLSYFKAQYRHCHWVLDIDDLITQWTVDAFRNIVDELSLFDITEISQPLQEKIDWIASGCVSKTADEIKKLNSEIAAVSERLVNVAIGDNYDLARKYAYDERWNWAEKYPRKEWDVFNRERHISDINSVLRHLIIFVLAKFPTRQDCSHLENILIMDGWASLRAYMALTYINTTSLGIQDSMYHIYPLAQPYKDDDEIMMRQEVMKRFSEQEHR